MESNPKRLLHMVIGMVDYLREKSDELSDEWVERGEDKEEDFKEFVEDLKDKIPIFKKSGDDDDDDLDMDFEDDDDDEKSSSGGGNFISEMIEKLNVKQAIIDTLQDLGLANKDKLDNLHDKLDDLEEKIKGSKK